ncbi:conserved hypothetical protein [Candidatus Terasakiella magnetica]|nr:conserved hypothetical protein [Candidatus Terasakiella magnetica]
MAVLHCSARCPIYASSFMCRVVRIMIVSAIRSKEFAGLVPDSGIAVLQIFDPTDDWTDETASLAAAGWGASLGLAFWDMDASALGVRGRLVVRLWGRHRALFNALACRMFGNDIPWQPFIAADAVEIAAFADRLALGGMREVLVVCRNGRGRSGTVGRWIARRLGVPFQTSGDDREADHIRETLDRIGGHTAATPNLPEDSLAA